MLNYSAHAYQYYFQLSLSPSMWLICSYHETAFQLDASFSGGRACLCHTELCTSYEWPCILSHLSCNNCVLMYAHESVTVTSVTQWRPLIPLSLSISCSSTLSLCGHTAWTTWIEQLSEKHEKNWLQSVLLHPHPVALTEWYLSSDREKKLALSWVNDSTWNDETWRRRRWRRWRRRRKE